MFCGECHCREGGGHGRPEVLFLPQNTLNINEMFKVVAKFFSSSYGVFNVLYHTVWKASSVFSELQV